MLFVTILKKKYVWFIEQYLLCFQRFCALFYKLTDSCHVHTQNFSLLKNETIFTHFVKVLKVSFTYSEIKSKYNKDDI